MRCSLAPPLRWRRQRHRPPKFLAPPNESFVIASVDDTRRFVRERRVRFFDLGGSSGGSPRVAAARSRRPNIRDAGDVVALDVDAAKSARSATRRTARVRVRADVRALDWRGAPPVVSGVILFHVLEHLNALRARAARARRGRARVALGRPGRAGLRHAGRGGRRADAAEAPRSAWRRTSCSCADSRDGEDALNARGFARAYAAWHGHARATSPPATCSTRSGPSPASARTAALRRSRDARPVVAAKHAPIKDSSHPHVLPLLDERGSDEARRKGHKTCGGTLCDTHRCVVRRPRSTARDGRARARAVRLGATTCAHGPKAFAKFDRIHELFTAIILFRGSTAGQLSIEAQVMPPECSSVCARMAESWLTARSARTGRSPTSRPSGASRGCNSDSTGGRKTDWDAFGGATGTTAMARTKKRAGSRRSLQNRLRRCGNARSFDRSHGAGQKNRLRNARQSAIGSQNRDRSHRAPGGQPPADCSSSLVGVRLPSLRPRAEATRLVPKPSRPLASAGEHARKRFLRRSSRDA